MNRRDLRDQLLKVLETAQKERTKRQVMVGGELAWITYERHQMFNAVLKARGALGKPPLALSEIARVETMASGHSDYSSKFALYCAELVLDANPQP